MDIWSFALMIVEMFVYQPFLRADSPESLLHIQSHSEVKLSQTQFPNNIQAFHLVSQMLRKRPEERISISAIIVGRPITKLLDTKSHIHNPPPSTNQPVID
jgi:serine/threonine protein kinase